MTWELSSSGECEIVSPFFFGQDKNMRYQLPQRYLLWSRPFTPFRNIINSNVWWIIPYIKLCWSIWEWHSSRAADVFQSLKIPGDNSPTIGWCIKLKTICRIFPIYKPHWIRSGYDVHPVTNLFAEVTSCDPSTILKSEVTGRTGNSVGGGYFHGRQNHDRQRARKHARGAVATINTHDGSIANQMRKSIGDEENSLVHASRES